MALLGSLGSAQEAGIAVGRLQLYPTFGAALGYDDNLALRNEQPISSRYLLLEPGIRAELRTRRSRVRAQYRMKAMTGGARACGKTSSALSIVTSTSSGIAASA